MNHCCWGTPLRANDSLACALSAMEMYKGIPLQLTRDCASAEGGRMSLDKRRGKGVKKLQHIHALDNTLTLAND